MYELDGAQQVEQVRPLMTGLVVCSLDPPVHMTLVKTLKIAPDGQVSCCHWCVVVFANG